MREIVISHRNGKTSAAVLEDGELTEFFDGEPHLVGNIYKGRVENFLPGMRAAFVNIGQERNAFLQFNSPKKFFVGQDVILQIEKDSVGAKGARATIHVSLAGRRLILLPAMNYIGVSNKIRGEERNRLHMLAKKN